MLLCQEMGAMLKAYKDQPQTPLMVLTCVFTFLPGRNCDLVILPLTKDAHTDSQAFPEVLSPCPDSLLILLVMTIHLTPTNALYAGGDPHL